MLEGRFSRRSGVAGVLAALGAVLPPVAVFAPLVAAPLLAVAVLAVLAMDWRRVPGELAGLGGLIALLAALALWGALSARWSLLPEHSFGEAIRFLAESAGGLVLFAEARAAMPLERRRIAIGIGAGLALAIALVLIERFGGAPISHLLLGHAVDAGVPMTRFDRGTTVLVFAAWPALAFLRSWTGVALALLILAVSAIMTSDAALLAMAASLVVYFIARLAPRFCASLMAAAAVAAGIALPLATPSNDAVLALHRAAPWLKFSALHRLLIWRFAADRAGEHPVLGWGMDASRAIPGGHTDFRDVLPAIYFPSLVEAMPLHPHNALLQWLLELGVPGLCLGLAIVVWGLWQVGFRAALSPASRAAALAWAGAALVVATLSFGVWQSWWISTLWLTAALFASVADDRT